MWYTFWYAGFYAWQNAEGDLQKDHLSDASGQKEQDDKKQKSEQNAGTTSSGKQTGKQVKESSQGEEAPKQNYIHVRARRGQATNSHSLAERVITSNILACYINSKWIHYNVLNLQPCPLLRWDERRSVREWDFFRSLFLGVIRWLNYSLYPLVAEETYCSCEFYWWSLALLFKDYWESCDAGRNNQLCAITPAAGWGE